MKRLFASLLLLIAASAAPLYSYIEYCFPNLAAPTNLSPGNFELSYQHRFLGTVSDSSSFLGLSNGADASMALRWCVLSTLEAAVSYAVVRQEFDAGASYALIASKIFLRSQLNAYWYNTIVYDSLDNQKRINSFFFDFSLQTEPILRMLVPTINAGYDVYRRSAGTANFSPASLARSLK